jgi:hypothetical protein
MQAQSRRIYPGRESAIALLALAALALCAFQFGDRYGLNSMPFAQVQRLASDLATAKKMAMQGNIDLFVGETMQGPGCERPRRGLRRELLLWRS